MDEMKMNEALSDLKKVLRYLHEVLIRTSCEGTPNALWAEKTQEKVLSYLSELAVIEKRLGVDMSIPLKALYKGVYVRFPHNINDIKYIARPHLCLNGSLRDGRFLLIPVNERIPFGYGLKEYGKTWAFTKKELEEAK